MAPLLILAAQSASGMALEALGRDSTFSGRTLIWQVAWEYVAPRPLLGYGFGATTYGGFARTILQWLGVDSPHNGYLDLTLSIGIVGLLVFVLSVLGVLYPIRRAPDGLALRAAAAIVLSWLVAGASEVCFRPGSGLAAIAYPTLAAIACLAFSPVRSAAARLPATEVATAAR
jgi:O-antigen ligase